MAAGAVLLIAPYLIFSGVIAVGAERALINAHLATDTAFRVAFYDKF
jgi:hypothetical protein